MKTKIVVTGIVFSILFCTPVLHAQKIIKTLKQYILIDTDKNLGGIGDSLYVMTGQGPSAKSVARVVIAKFQDGKAAARIISGTVQNGYFVSRVSKQQVDKVRDTLSDDSEYYGVQRVVKGYVLIGPNAPFDKKGKSLIVKRKTPFGYVDVGSVKVVKNQDGMVAAQIINQINPYTIQKGDLIAGKNVSPSKEVLDVLDGNMTEDIDYYFFGPYNPN